MTENRRGNFPTWSTRSICPLERNPFQDEESGRFGFTKLDVVVGLRGDFSGLSGGREYPPTNALANV